MAENRISPFGGPGHFYECPHWHGGRWWITDMRGQAVYSFSQNGEVREELRLEERPGGLGWSPDGALLVVAMDSKKLLRWRPGSRSVEEFADASVICSDIDGFLNDMAVSKSGHAYIGFDADYTKYKEPLGMIVHVAPDGRAEIVARELAMPNGIVFAPDGNNLLVAETFRPNIVGFKIEASGKLGPPDAWAVLEPKADKRQKRQPGIASKAAMMDGCDIDSEGHIWVADIYTACLRVAPGGDIVDAIFLPDGLNTVACGLGGSDGRTLMICGAESDVTDRVGKKSSHLFTARVDVPAV